MPISLNDILIEHILPIASVSYRKLQCVFFIQAIPIHSLYNFFVLL